MHSFNKPFKFLKNMADAWYECCHPVTSLIVFVRPIIYFLVIKLRKPLSAKIIPNGNIINTEVSTGLARTCAPSLVRCTWKTSSLWRSLSSWSLLVVGTLSRRSKQFPHPDTDTSGGPNTATGRREIHRRMRRQQLHVRDPLRPDHHGTLLHRWCFKFKRWLCNFRKSQ